ESVHPAPEVAKVGGRSRVLWVRFDSALADWAPCLRGHQSFGGRRLIVSGGQRSDHAASASSSTSCGQKYSSGPLSSCTPRHPSVVTVTISPRSPTYPHGLRSTLTRSPILTAASPTRRASRSAGTSHRAARRPYRWS